MNYSNLQSPIKIGNVFIKNRIALAPMNDLHQFYNPEEGTINRKWINYFAERAKGGTGLLITGAFKVEDEITHFRQNGINIWALLKRKSSQNYAELVNYAHAYGAKIFIQLTAGPGRVVSGLSIDQGYEPISSSPNKAFFRPDKICRELETREVQKIVEAYGEAAEIVKNSGFDGIEVHGHEGYLIDQFVTKLWNKRTDKYGGDIDGRLTFPIEILKAIKAGAGEDFTVIYRYGSKHFLKDPDHGTLRKDDNEAGRDLPESIQIAKKLEAAGYDGLHIDAGCYESAYWAHPPMYMPEGLCIDLTAKIKAEVNIPVIGVGRLGNPALAESAVADNKADMVALGRDLLSDPYWPSKAFSGKAEEIRYCIGCHECMNMAENGRFLTCAVNPYCGNESDVVLKPAEIKKKIAVIGGGIAGIESALILKQRGHNVTVFEKTDKIGGNVVIAGKPEFKNDINKLLNWYRYKIKKEEIKINFDTDFDVSNEHDKFDIYIVATGAVEKEIMIPGIQEIKSSVDVLDDPDSVGKKVIIIGGGIEGCELSVWLSDKGHEVTLVEMLDELSRDYHRANRQMLLQLIEDRKINVLKNSKVQNVHDSKVSVINDALEIKEINFDTIVSAVGMKSENSLYEGLLKRGEECYLIGDGFKPGKISDAIWQATVLCVNL